MSPDRLTAEVLYELLETGTEDGVYVEALDVRAPGADIYGAQRAAEVTVAELAGALIATRAERDQLQAALERIGRALFQPAALPEGCPSLVERILMAIEELERERTEARSVAHDLATEFTGQEP